MSDFDKELDTSGLKLPIANYKSKKGDKHHGVRSNTHVISTDPGAVMDFESFAGQTGNELLSLNLKIINFSSL